MTRNGEDTRESRSDLWKASEENVFVKEKEGSKMKKRRKEEEIEKEGRRSGRDAEKILKERAACSALQERKSQVMVITSQPNPPPRGGFG